VGTCQAHLEIRLGEVTVNNIGLEDVEPPDLVLYALSVLRAIVIIKGREMTAMFNTSAEVNVMGL